MAVLLRTVLCLLAAASITNGAAFRSMPKEMTIRYGTKDQQRTVVRRYCEWNGQQVLPGSTWTTACCMHCTCTEQGLDCYTHGVYMPLPGCTVLVNESCEVEMVDSSDPNRPCEPLTVEPPGGVVPPAIHLEVK